MKQFDWTTVPGTVKPGHQIASGKSAESPYEKGSLELQRPHLQACGLDISHFYLGTINVSIVPYTFALVEPTYTFHEVKWHPRYPAETFSFSPCVVEYQGESVQALVYYPHPETKIGHFQAPSIVEIIAPSLSGLAYGDRLTLQLNPQEIQLINNGAGERA